MRRWKQQLAVCLCLILGWSNVALSAPESPHMSSTTYSVDESEIGGNGCVNLPTGTSTGTYSCGASGSYSLNPNEDGGSSLGEFATGNSSSASYSNNAGYDTTAQPALIVTVNTTGVTLVPSPMSVAAGSFAAATFDVSNYTSSGYSVKIIGTPPSYGTHTLAALATDTASSPGTEQFGVNTVNNNTDGWGADPLCVVTGFCNATQVAGDNTVGLYGSTRPYTWANHYRFVSGESVASGTKTSGDTRFTMTFMANMGSSGANPTPAGVYSGSLTLLVTGQY